MSGIYVFLGPTLPWEEGGRILPGATFQPPAKAGDVYMAVKRGAKVIAIIDGFFEQVPSVWHKEVLFALSQGVHVFGASSMGALRAAELHAFGMVGIGRIFEAYRDGVYEDDDEVAVFHAGPEAGFKTFSEAMVNVRDGLAQALERGLISKLTHDTISREMKRRNYTHRTWLAVPEIARNENLPPAEADALIAFVRTERPDRKRQDAIELLSQIRFFAGDPPVAFEPDFEFEHTVFWDQLVVGVRSAPGASAVRTEVPIEAIRSHVGVVEDDAESIFQGALLLYLAVKEARRVGIVTDPEKVKRVAERFRRSHGMDTDEAMEEWLRRNSLGDLEFSALMEVLALVEAVANHHSSGLDAFLPAEIQRRGRFESMASAILEKRRAIADFSLSFPSAEDVGTTTADLLAWYEARFRNLDPSFDEHREVRRVTDGTRFVREVLMEYIRQGQHTKRTV